MSLQHLIEAGRLAKELTVGPVSFVINVTEEGLDVFGTIRDETRSSWTRVHRIKYRDLDAAPTNILTDAIMAMNRSLRGTRR